MIKYIKNFIRKHVVAPFPYADECFYCNKEYCTGYDINN